MVDQIQVKVSGLKTPKINTFYANPNRSFRLQDATDVAVSNPSNNQILIYDSDIGKFTIKSSASISTAQDAYNAANTALLNSANAVNSSITATNTANTAANQAQLAYNVANTKSNVFYTTFITNNGLTVNTGTFLQTQGNASVILAANGASTTGLGVVQLNDTITDTSTSLAATSNAVATVMTYARHVSNTATASFSTANDINIFSGSAFERANAAFVSSNNVNTFAQTGFNVANSASNLAQSAFNRANNSTNYTQTYKTTNGLTVNNVTSITVSGNTDVTFSANNASTTEIGVVQLNDTLVSTSTTQAITPNVANTIWNHTKASFDTTNAVNTFAGSAYVRANVAIQNQFTVTATGGIAVGGGSTQTAIGNTTIALTANSASTTAPGAVQLNDTFTSTATNQAVTPNVANTIWNHAKAAFTTTNAVNTYAGTAYGRANAEVQNQFTFQASGGISVNSGSTITVVGNNTVIISGNSASTTAVGSVQLNDTFTSTVTNQAVTPNVANTIWNHTKAAYNTANDVNTFAGSAYGRANASIQNQITLTASNGLTANGGSTATLVGNNTIALSTNNATTTTVGVVQLNDTFTSTATNQAVTPNVANTIWTTVKAAFDKANTGVASGQTTVNYIAGQALTVNSGVSIAITGNNTLIIAANSGSTTEIGVLQLNDTVTSTSVSLAATANAVNTVWTTAKAAFNRANSGGGGSGIVTYQTQNGLTVNGTNEISITGNDTVIFAGVDGTTSAKGVVQLNDTVLSTSSTLAATANSVNTAWSYAQTAFATANAVNTYAGSAYGRANAAVQNQFIINATGGVAVGGGSTQTAVGNTTITLTANAASTTVIGSVQLNDTFTSTVTNQAVTPNVANTIWNHTKSSYNTANAINTYAGSAYARANAEVQNQFIVTATGGVAVGGGSTQTAVGNTTIALTANAGSTTVLGVVQLNDTVLSTSSSLAATANSVNTVWSYAQTAFATANAVNTYAGSAYGRANTSIQNQVTLTATGGISANGGSTATLVGNNTIALTGNTASTTAVGVVQLNDTFISTSTTQAVTPNVANTIWNHAKAAYNKANAGGGSASTTFQTQNGLTVNGASSLTISGNDTAIFAAVDGTTSTKGIVQLNDTVLSTSTSLAATANSVNTAWSYAQTAFITANAINTFAGSAYSRANAAVQNQFIVTATGGVAVGGGSTQTAVGNTTIALTANAGSTTVLGVVQLNDTVLSTSSSLAATANSVNTAWSYAQTAFITANAINTYAGSAYGRANAAVQNQFIVTATGGVAVGGGSTQTAIGNTTIALTANSATTSAVGVVQLNDTVLSTSSTLAATANSVNTAWSYAQTAFSTANAVNTFAGSAYARANAAVQNQFTVTATGGIAVGGGSTQTAVGNTTIALTANSASTTVVGVVQLNDTVLSTSTSLAATANSVNTAWSYAQTAFSTANAVNAFAGSAYARANSAVQNQFIVTATGGLAVGGGSTQTAVGNTTIALTANAGSTSVVGVVQLTDDITSSSTTTATTPRTANVTWRHAQAAFDTANAVNTYSGTSYALANTHERVLNTTGNNVIIMGSSANSRGISGRTVYANGSFANIGDAQFGTTLLRIQTTSSSNTSNMSTSGANTTTNVYGSMNQLQLGNNAVYAFSAMVAARDVTNMSAKIWEVRGGIKNVVGPPNTTPLSNTNIMGTPIINVVSADNGTNNWTISLATDLANNALLFRATGATNQTNWVAKVDTVEVA